MNVALLGTGTMGAGMAQSMRRAKLDVRVWNRTRAKAEPLAEHGIEVCDSVTDAVTGTDVVVTMLFDADAVRSVADELTAALGDQAVWLQSATVGPEGIKRIAAAAPNARLVDAPMLGTKQPAVEGKLVPLVSGPADLIEIARPVLDAVGTKTVVAGTELGQGSALKLACNAWILSLTAAIAQSVALTDAQGLDPHLFLEAIGGGASDTPYAQLKGTSMMEHNFGAQFGLDGGRKDLDLITDAAHGAGVDTTLLDAVRAQFGRASDQGHGTDDISAVYTALRIEANSRR